MKLNGRQAAGLALGLGCILIIAALIYHAKSVPSSDLIKPEELVKILRAPQGEKPLLIHVGAHVLYLQGHIPGSEYIGPASKESGVRQLQERVEKLPRNQPIVIYCGCCPWEHCPNVHPADRALRALGFRNVKMLYLPNNFGADWIDKGYDVAKGE